MNRAAPRVDAFASATGRPHGISRRDVFAFAEAWARGNDHGSLTEYLGWDPEPQDRPTRSHRVRELVSAH